MVLTVSFYLFLQHLVVPTPRLKARRHVQVVATAKASEHACFGSGQHRDFASTTIVGAGGVYRKNAAITAAIRGQASTVCAVRYFPGRRLYGDYVPLLRLFDIRSLVTPIYRFNGMVRVRRLMRDGCVKCSYLYIGAQLVPSRYWFDSLHHEATLAAQGYLTFLLQLSSHRRAVATSLLIVPIVLFKRDP